jgi:hypothetical protein
VTGGPGGPQAEPTDIATDGITRDVADGDGSEGATVGARSAGTTPVRRGRRRGRADTRPRTDPEVLLARRVGAAAGALMLVLGALWAVMTPLFASPDEPAHTVRAVATWTGDPDGTEVQLDAGAAGTVTVKDYEVPSPYHLGQELAVCSAFRPLQPANCGPPFVPTGEDEVAQSTAGFYPPLFYVAVGWGAAVRDGASGMYLMRLTHVLMCAALIGFAAWALVIRRGRMALAGLTVAVTPMVAFLAGTLNSSGIEIAASICLWAAAVLALDPPGRWRCARWAPPVLVVASGLVLSFSRTFSPGYALVILAIAVVATPGLGPRTLLARRDLLLPGAVVVAGAAIATLLIVRSGQFDTPATSGAPLSPGETPLSAGIGFQEASFRQMVAVFGWLDTGTAQLAYYCWIVAWGALMTGAVVLGAWRRLLGAGLALAGAVVLPIAANWGQAATAGFVWQGRYSLPFAVGAPLLAAVAWDESAELALRLRRRALTLVVSLAAVGHVYGVYWALRRWTVGVAGELVFFFDTEWSPPVIGAAGAMLIIVVLAVGAVVLIARLPEPAAPDPA